MHPFIMWQFVFPLFLILFGQVASFEFTDVNPKLVKAMLLEMNRSYNYSISCTTDDANASTTLLFANYQSPIPHELPVGGRISLSNQVYTIHGLVLTDSGTYTCEATSGQAGTVRKSLTLFLFEEEIPCCPTVFPMKKVIIRGTRTSFTCKVDIKNSIPKYLVFKWYRQENGTSVEVPSSETYRHNESASVLMIENAKATPKTGILYKCQTLYKGRKSDSNGPRLVVHNPGAPVITHLPGSVAVNEPNKLTLRCEANGFPLPKITWLRNGTKLPVCVKSEAVDRCAGENYQVSEQADEDRDLTESYLVIATTKYPRDHGKYTCLAKNSETALKDVEVSIQECSDDPNYADICPTKAAIDGYCAFHRQFMQQLCCKSCRFQ